MPKMKTHKGAAKRFQEELDIRGLVVEVKARVVLFVGSSPRATRKLWQGVWQQACVESLASSTS